MATRLISAVGTPLDDEEGLHLEGLAAHLEAQWQAGIDGVLVGGTMGLLQMLREPTYQQLVHHSARLCDGRGELLVGVGDTSLARTAERIELLNAYPVDGAVVVTPYFLRFREEELVAYYHRLADRSRAPLYLYDQPAITGVKLGLDLVRRAAEHPNIAGIKCSGEVSGTRQLIAAVGAGFRVIIAQATRLGELCLEGLPEHLDGVYALAPTWVAAIRAAADKGDAVAVAAGQERLNALLDVLHGYGVFPAFTALLNAQGVPGRYAPAPLQPLREEAHERLLDEPVVRELLQGQPLPDSTVQEPA